MIKLLGENTGLKSLWPWITQKGKSRKENIAILHFIQIKVGWIQNRALKNKDKPQP